MNGPIDIVVTWVDQEDPTWQESYNEWHKKEVAEGIQVESNRQAFGKERYRNWALFPFWFRCVEKNCPWVNKVFLVVQKASQVPSWINKKNPKLRIVYHDEFIPKEFLPTFNIMPINMYLHRIPDLSDNYISCDDDFYFLKPIPEDLFFRNNVPVDKFLYKPGNWVAKKKTVFTQILKNKDELIMKELGSKQKCYGDTHLPIACKKSFEKQIYLEYKDIIDKSFSKSKFRHPDNLINWFYKDMLKVRGKEINDDIYAHSKCMHLGKPSVEEMIEGLNNYQMTTLNDTEFVKDFTEKQSAAFMWFMHNFPEASSFEIDYNKMKKEKIALVACAKKEHNYVHDWAKYYFNLGVDHIFICDNDDLESPYIGDYINLPEHSSDIDIIDIRGQREDSLQQHTYEKIYREHINEYNWFCFFDLDEFLEGTQNLKYMLKQIPEEFKQVRIQFQTFTDSDKLTRDVKNPVYLDLLKQVSGQASKYNLGCKSIVRGGIDNIFMHSVHFASFDNERTNILPQCTPSGINCGDLEINIEDESIFKNEIIKLNHYRTKTLQEFIDQKLNRSDCVFGNRTISFKYFFSINEKTWPKVSLLKKYGIDVPYSGSTSTPAKTGANYQIPWGRANIHETEEQQKEAHNNYVRKQLDKWFWLLKNGR